MFEVDEEPESSSDSSVELEKMAAQPIPSRAKTAEQIAREQPGPNLEEIKVPPTPQQPQEPVVDAGGNVNYAAVYRMANIGDSPFTAEQVLDILNSLPAELPIEAKRATLKVTLAAIAKTNGVTQEAVVADASRKLTALGAFAETYSEHARQYIAKAEQQIAAAEAEIQRLRQGIADAKAKEGQAIQSCQKECDRLDDVLEFFSLDVPPSKYAQS
jgi:hypothetical protein